MPFVFFLFYKFYLNHSVLKGPKAITEKEINKMYDDIFTECDRDLKKLKTLLEQQKNKDEQERLKKIQVCD